jgi:hypothetical protein
MFPHVSQAYLIERHVTALDGTSLSEVAALGVTFRRGSTGSWRSTPAARWCRSSFLLSSFVIL